VRGQGLTGIRKLALLAALAAAACVAALGGGAASASTTGNHTVFSDPAGDAQSSSSSNYAADIRQVDVTSVDNGQLTVAVTLVDADAKLVNGDELAVYIDIDRNSSTGDSNGFEYEFLATGSSSGTSFVFCTLLAPRSCQEFQSGSAHDQATSTTTHVVDFSIATNAAAFDFAVIESYTQPGGSTSLYDYAPDSGVFSFETKTDPDGDGLYGSGDKCPTVAAPRKLDKNNNGCPGPFKFIGTKEAHFTGLSYPTFLRLTQLRISGAVAGAKVVFSSPKGGETAKANASGAAKSKRLKGDFRYGSVITIRITKPAFVGVYLKEKIAKSGLKVVKRLCIPVTGGAPVKCSGKLKGS
jgi:hypothetical protein